MILYKYRELNDFTIESLKENYFWSPSKEDLNDPCECYYTTESYEKVIRFTSKISTNLEKATIGLSSSFNIIQKMSKNLGIFSLSKSYNISSLWASYAGNHTGICIEYDLEELISENKGLYQYFDVAYSNTPPDIGVEDFQGITLLQKMFGTKHHDWDKEQEFRVVCDKQGKNYHRSDAIRSIIFGLKTSEKSKYEIMELLAGRNIQFKQLVNDGKSYGFHTQDIVNPFDKKTKLNDYEEDDFKDIVPDNDYIKDEYKVYAPYLYKAAVMMKSNPDCIEIFNMDFSEASTVKDPIIYVNFKEKGSNFLYSKKLFRVKEMSL